MSDYVPNDVWANILVKLPIKNLVQCSCVCKSWYFLITSPTFISKHLNYTTQLSTNHNDLFLIRHDHMSVKMYLYALHFDTQKFDKYMEVNCPFVPKNEYFTIVGSLNGLICMADCGYCTSDLIIWNPMTTKTLVLPESLIGLSEPGSFFHGFGFDGVRDDYVVVRIVYETSWTCGFVVPPSVEIYRLSTRSWKTLCHGLPQYYLINNLGSTHVVNGAMHWFGASSRHLNDDVIVAFDMSDEVFKDIMLPEGVADINGFGMCVGVLESSLALLEYEKLIHSDYCWIWVMTEYGIRESWTKLYTIDMRGGIGYIVAFGRRNEVRVMSKVLEMCSYDLHTKQLTNLGIDESRSDSSFYTNSYVESLVLLKRSDRVSSPESCNDANINAGSPSLNGEEGRIEELQ